MYWEYGVIGRESTFVSNLVLVYASGEMKDWGVGRWVQGASAA